MIASWCSTTPSSAPGAEKGGAGRIHAAVFNACLFAISCNSSGNYILRVHAQSRRELLQRSWLRDKDYGRSNDRSGAKDDGRFHCIRADASDNPPLSEDVQRRECHGDRGLYLRHDQQSVDRHFSEREHVRRHLESQFGRRNCRLHDLQFSQTAAEYGWIALRVGLHHSFCEFRYFKSCAGLCPLTSEFDCAGFGQSVAVLFAGRECAA